MPNDEPLAKLARAVLDGAPVDWVAAESTADDAGRVVLRQLRLVEELAAVHRQAADAPESWSHLRILECIGRGSFGAVYRARDPRLDRDVALKLLPAPPPSADRPQSSIIEEGRLLARVRHANVVTIHGAEQIGGQIGLWMELVQGQTLEQLLQNGTFTPAQVIDIALELCGAVSAVHGAGLLHRDIKAHNVTRAEDGRIVLMDFGAGRELDDSSSPDLTGTPLYLAPEIFRGDPATVHSDLYSLGVLMYHLLTGRYPVQGRTIGELRQAHERLERASVHLASPDAQPLMRIIERLTDAVPSRRYSSAEALGTDLRNLKQHSRVRWRLPILVTLAVLVTAAGVAWDLWGHTMRSERGAAFARAVRPAIAVLPFRNEGARPGTDEFVDGLTYEIQRNLAAIDGLDLRSSMSSFAFKNQPRNLADIRTRLGVDFVLEGSVFTAGETLRVNARLANAADDVTVWTESFDRQSKDVFAIQDDISLAIVNKLRLKLGRGLRRYETAPDVYYDFLRARGFQIEGSPVNAAKAVDVFQQVVAKDPAYVPAWAGLASAFGTLSRLALNPDLPPLDPRMEAAALKAIQLDPLSAEALAAMGSLYARERHWVQAEAAFLKSIELNPTLTTTHTDFVISMLMPLGRLDDALRVLEQARRVDPESLDVRRSLAHVQVDAGRYEEAIANCRWVMERNPKFPYVDSWLGRALILEGKPDQALAVFEQNPKAWGYLGYHLAVTGRRAEAEAMAAEHPEDPKGQMLIYGGLGDKERTFEALDRLAAQNWWRAATWMRRPEVALLRDDPRFDAMKKRLGLPQ